MKTVEVGFHVDGDVWEPEQIKAVEGHGFDIMTTGEHILYLSPNPGYRNGTGICRCHYHTN